MDDVRAEARRRIRAYLDHLEDGAYARAIVALADVPTITDLLTEMVRHGDAKEVGDALLVVRDVVNYGMLPEFMAYLPASGLFPILADGVYDDRLAVRDACIYTLGKLTFRENAPILAGAFPWYVERDPLLLPSLIGELVWLTNYANYWFYLEAAAAHASYLTRWASLDTTNRFGWDTRPDAADANRLEAFYERLAADPHPFVRPEAAHALAGLRLGWDARALPRGERRRRYRALRAAAPPLTFLRLTSLFNHFLHVLQQADYTVDLLDAFAHYAHEHPYEPGTDVHAWARVFAASSGELPMEG